MPISHAVVLAVVQALTEFLPISSTAHLVLIPWLFGWKDAGFTFDVALHAGTLAAILIYFFRDWVQNTNGIRLLRRK
jgi:undecaprenyl-diphosphatase